MRGPHRRGSGPACGRVLGKRRERVRARFLSRGGDSGAGPQRVIKGSQPTQRNTLGLARGSAPSNPDRGEFPPVPHHPRRVSGMLSTTTARASPSERKALWLLKSPATWTRHRGYFGGALVCLHRLDPQRRKSSSIPRPFEAGFSCSHWTIFSMTTSKPPWRSPVSCPTP